MKSTISNFVLFLSLNLSLGQYTGQINMNTASGPFSGNPELAYLLGPIAERDRKISGEMEHGIQGSAYTTEKLIPGRLYYKESFEGDIFYRYNAYYEQIEITKYNLNGAPMNILNPDKNVRIISSDGYSISFKTFIDRKNLTQNGYLTKIREGKYALYRRVNVKYTEGQKSLNSFVKAIPARFSKFVEYYLEIEGVNKIMELEMNKRKFLKLIPEDKREGVKKFIQANKIKFKNEYALFEVLEFLNES